jgi:hypothetical protein
MPEAAHNGLVANVKGEGGGRGQGEGIGSAVRSRCRMHPNLADAVSHALCKGMTGHCILLEGILQLNNAVLYIAV